MNCAGNRHAQVQDVCRRQSPVNSGMMCIYEFMMLQTKYRLVGQKRFSYEHKIS